MITPAELFDRAGRALYGDQYVAPMAVLLDLDKSDIRVETWVKIQQEAAQREKTLGLLKEAMEVMISPPVA